MRRAWRTHSLALGEVAAVIGSRRGGKLARDAYQRIRDTIEVEVPTLAQMDLAMRQVVRSNGQLSLADGLFANQVTAADDAAVLSFDMDFDRFGIRRLPER
jgi:predicted nucleic acid-binding protein